MMSFLRQKSTWVFAAIVLIALFFRFYQLGNTPAGLINDEADTGYDAYSVLLTGHDQWNSFLPLVSMKGFGDYRPALYTYIVAGSEKLFGLNTFAVRFPSALFGVFSVVLMYMVGKKLFSEKVGLVAALFMAISPWAIGMSRVGIESNVAIFFTLMGLWLFLSAKHKPLFLILGAVAFLLAIYTYAAYTLFIPFAGLSVFFFWGKALPLSRKSVLGVFVVVVIACIPFFVSRSTAHTRLSQVGFFNSLDTVGLVSMLNAETGACWQGIPHVVCKVVLNKPLLFTSVYLKNYLSHFSPELLYIAGSATQFAILPARGLEYLIEALFGVMGIFFLLSSKKKEGVFVLILLLFAAIPDALTGIGHYSRATVMLPFLLFIEASGFWYILLLIKGKNKQKIIGVFMGVVLFVSVAGFWIIYMTYFRQQYAIYSQYGYQAVIQNIDKQKNTYNTIYLSRHLNDTKQYIYYLFYNAYSPTIYQKKTGVSYSESADGWISIDKIDNIAFVSNIPTREQVLVGKTHNLFISNPVDFPKNIPSVFLVKDLQGNIIFEAVDSTVLQNYYATHAAAENS